MPRSRSPRAKRKARSSASRYGSISPICDPMWKCRPRKSSDGRSAIIPTPVAASSDDRESPNFESAAPVCRCSWVRAATAGLTRRRTAWRVPRSAACVASRSISSRLSMTTRPTRSRRASSSSSPVLLLPWNEMRSRGKSTPAATWSPRADRRFVVEVDRRPVAQRDIDDVAASDEKMPARPHRRGVGSNPLELREWAHACSARWRRRSALKSPLMTSSAGPRSRISPASSMLTPSAPPGIVTVTSGPVRPRR